MKIRLTLVIGAKSKVDLMIVKYLIKKNQPKAQSPSVSRWSIFRKLSMLMLAEKEFVLRRKKGHREKWSDVLPFSFQ